MQLRVAAVCAGALLLAGCGAPDALRDEESGESIWISASEYEEEWPFVVDGINLRCGDAARNHVVFEANGATYALNGSARGSIHVEKGNWKDSRELMERTHDALPPVPWGLIERGLQLCKSAR